MGIVCGEHQKGRRAGVVEFLALHDPEDDGEEDGVDLGDLDEIDPVEKLAPEVE